jgi:hypothetical protein
MAKCNLCDDGSEWLPSSEPERTASTEELAPLDPEAQARLADWYARAAQRTATHEAADVIMGLATGRGVESVQASGDPAFVSYKNNEGLPAGVYVKCSLSGPIGTGFAEHRILPHSREEIVEYLDRARAGTVGRCDECNSARMLVAKYPTFDNDTLANLWLSFWRSSVRFFDSFPAYAALGKLAKALRERRRLSGDEVAEIIDAATLRETYDELEAERIRELEAKIKAGVELDSQQ